MTISELTKLTLDVLVDEISPIRLSLIEKELASGRKPEAVLFEQVSSIRNALGTIGSLTELAVSEYLERVMRGELKRPAAKKRRQ